MVNIAKKRKNHSQNSLSFYAAAFFVICTFSVFTSGIAWAEEAAPEEDVFVPHSASELGANAGLIYNKPLVVGRSEQVRAGHVPLAGTLPVTFGKISSVSIEPEQPPPAQKMVLSPGGFDADSLYADKQYNPVKSDIYDRLFMENSGENRKSARFPLRLKYANVPAQEDFEAQEKGKKPQPKAAKPKDNNRQKEEKSPPPQRSTNSRSRL